MSFNVENIPSRVIEAARQRRLIPLIGAGVSKQAGVDFPTWPVLLDRLRQDAVKSSYIDKQESDEMISLLDRGQRFPFEKVADAHRALESGTTAGELVLKLS